MAQEITDNNVTFGDYKIVHVKKTNYNDEKYDLYFRFTDNFGNKYYTKDDAQHPITIQHLLTHIWWLHENAKQRG